MHWLNIEYYSDRFRGLVPDKRVDARVLGLVFRQFYYNFFSYHAFLIIVNTVKFY